MNTTQLKQIFKVKIVVGTLVLVFLSLTIAVSSVVASPESTQSVTQEDSNWGIGLGAGIAIGLAGLGAGLGLGSASSAAIGAIAERPEVFGRTIIFIAFIEGIGVFGFVIAFLLSLSLG
ncbi:V-type ATP synthase subunit K [Candidatus Heimdallarchaeota archaeon B3_Heim]|nr:MAG: V-type ATP synthase subunit K [Candidatus Heimdallarchaeota archaeon B3_Heim]